MMVHNEGVEFLRVVVVVESVLYYWWPLKLLL